MLKSYISTYTQITTTCLHVVWCYLFIVKLQWDVFGAAMALNVTYIINFLAQEIYIRTIEREFFQPYLTRFWDPKTF